MKCARSILTGVLVILITVGAITGYAAPDSPSPIYLPLILSSGNNMVTISGTVLDSDSEPVPDVTIIDNFGITVVTDNNGDYSLNTQRGENRLIAIRSGFTFEPEELNLTASDNLSGQDFSAYTTCGDIMVNGSFTDAESGWNFPVSEISDYTADTDSSVYHSAPGSGRTGIPEWINPGDQAYTNTSSDAISQIYRIPSDADNAVLNMVIKPEFSGTYASGDNHYIQILDEGNNVLETLYSTDSLNEDWLNLSLPINNYIGNRIKIQFGSYNDGAGSTARMYFDDVRLNICTIAPDPPATCNRISNGSFEAGTSPWVLQGSIIPPHRANRPVVAGTWSMQTGIQPSDTNLGGFSEFYQDVSIPSSAPGAILSFYVFTTSNEPTADSSAPSESIEADILSLAAPAIDTQYAYVFDTEGNVLKKLFWWPASATYAWTYLQFDLNSFKGQTVRILFGTYNDGIGGVTAMWVDKVLLDACDTTPPPPPPPACNIMSNSDFEAGSSSWILQGSVISSDGYVSPVHSMQTGIPSWGINQQEFSEFYQEVLIPSSAIEATLSFYVYTTSSEPVPDASASAAAIEGDILKITTPTIDTQYAYVFDTSWNVLERLFWWSARDENSWVKLQFDLSKYTGQTVRILFGTYNDGVGGKTAMWVDDVFLDACGHDNGCYQALSNRSFENNSAWEIPSTVYPANYSTLQKHSGNRSMRIGIYYVPHNRYSYSATRQMITIPSSATFAELTIWIWPKSTEPDAIPDGALLEPQIVSGQLQMDASSSDAQYILILNKYKDTILERLWWESSPTRDDRSWNSYTFDLMPWKGKTITLHFGVFNNGSDGVTSMFVDDASVVICDP